MDLGLTGKVVLITGAARGIGAAVAKAFAIEGAGVAVNDIDRDRAEGTVGELRALGAKALAVPGDVTRADEVQRMVEASLAAFGRLDVLVNNAGIGRRSPFVQMEEAEWDRILDVNLKSVFLCSRAVLPRLSRGDGRIVSVASMWASAPAPELAHYAASKAGIVAVTRSLAVEFGPAGITVNAVAPGHIVTDMTSAMAPEALRKMRESVLLPHGLGAPEDIADAVLFLASARARHITGHVLAVNGGQWMG